MAIVSAKAPAVASWIQRAMEPQKKAGEFKRICMLGEPGAGKTTAAWTLAEKNREKILWLAFEDGLSVLGIPDPLVVYFNRENDVEMELNDILDQAIAKSGPFAPDGIFGKVEVICIDSMHKLSAFLLYRVVRYKLKKDPKFEKPGFDGYGILKETFIQLGEKLNALPFHVIVTSGVIDKDIEESDEKEVVMLIDGSYRKIIAYEFDEVLYMEKFAVGQKIEYRCYTNVYKGMKMLKSRHQVPKPLPYLLKNPDFAAVYFRGDFGEGGRGA